MPKPIDHPDNTTHLQHVVVNRRGRERRRTDRTTQVMRCLIAAAAAAILASGLWSVLGNG
ncbi:MAG: hypothetical protein QGF67_07260 [Lentisphaeria bacterium]|jgi:hypothetical protein|nr:hypothetical protein [Lentisphaeria bacterium]MDP7741221.1 hypothetical protein [Lentisphaeria bacterium]|tara:strand:- start:590 stop:769 length:180 start_codon:yes stop_codon:yes gene_type:complete